jgi:hypothetical protein
MATSFSDGRSREYLDYLTTHTSLSPIRRGFVPGFVNYKKGALDSQLQMIKFTSCLPMVGGSLRVLPASSITKTGRHDIAEILLKVALNIKNQKIKSNQMYSHAMKALTIFLHYRVRFVCSSFGLLL